VTEINKVVVVGSGPSSVAALRAILESGQRPLVLDFGIVPESTARLSQEIRRELVMSGRARRQLAGSQGHQSVGQKSWFDSFSAYQQPRESKLIYDPGLTVRASFGLGGFSRVWGATFQIDPDLDQLPVDVRPSSSDIDAVLGLVPHITTRLDGEISQHRGFVDASAPSQRLFGRLCSHAASSELRIVPSVVAINGGRDATACISCTECLTGCPVDAIWHSGVFIKKWVAEGLIDYRAGVHVDQIREHADHVELETSANGEKVVFRAERVFLGTGAISTGALLLRSGLVDRLEIRDTATAFGGLIDLRRPRLAKPHHGLSQFWITKEGQFLAQLYPPSRVHGYKALDRFRLPSFLVGMISSLLDFVHPILVYLPADKSSSLALKIRDGVVSVSRVQNVEEADAWKTTLKDLKNLFKQVGVVMPRRFFDFGSPGSGYHVGSSIPHGKLSDSLGRPFGLKRVHVVDSSVLMQLPLGSVTPTVMTNAHRIARTVYQ
jgi:ferredoxin